MSNAIEVDFEDLISHTIIKSDANSQSISIETKHTVELPPTEAVYDDGKPLKECTRRSYDSEEEEDDEESSVEESDPEYSPEMENVPPKATKRSTRRPATQKRYSSDYETDNEEEEYADFESSDGEWQASKNKKQALNSSQSEGNFQCDECDKKCVSQRGLLVHKNVHKRQKRE